MATISRLCTNLNLQRIVPILLLIALPAAAPAAAHAQTPAPAAPVVAERDGSHDFDFIIGAWKFHLKKLAKPLSGSHDWVEFEGSAVARKIWNGKANLDEVELDSPSGHLEGMTLRLYSPETHLWSLYWVSGDDSNPTPGVPTVGKFDGHGRGLFYDQEIWHGKLIWVRYDWSGITANAAHFEESFSTDGGATWELVWITDQVRQAS